MLDQREDGKTSHQASAFLGLPAELRIQIYAYIFSGHNIEVFLYDRRTEQDASDNNTVSDLDARYQRLLFRIEEFGDQRNTRDHLKAQQKGSLHALFPLANVCRQVRAEVGLSLYEGNTFAFLDYSRNYAVALPTWLASLHAKERNAISALAWPERQARKYQRPVMYTDGGHLGPPDRDCSGEFTELTGLKRVELRVEGDWRALSEFKGKEMDESEKAKIENGGWYNLRTLNDFTRMLAVKGMRG